MRVRQAALIVVALVAVVPGCGGSSPSAQSFRSDANRICLQFRRQAEAIDVNPGQTAHTIAERATLLRRMNRSFQRLTPPQRELRRFHRFLAVQRRSLHEMRRIQRFTAANEPKALEALKHEKPRIHVPPEQALEHPTGATLAEAMSIPAVNRYLRGLDALARASAPTERAGERLTRQLGFTACL